MAVSPSKRNEQQIGSKFVCYFSSAVRSPFCNLLFCSFSVVQLFFFFLEMCNSFCCCWLFLVLFFFCLVLVSLPGKLVLQNSPKGQEGAKTLDLSPPPLPLKLVLCANLIFSPFFDQLRFRLQAINAAGCCCCSADCNNSKSKRSVESPVAQSKHSVMESPANALRPTHRYVPIPRTGPKPQTPEPRPLQTYIVPYTLLYAMPNWTSFTAAADTRLKLARWANGR